MRAYTYYLLVLISIAITYSTLYFFLPEPYKTYMGTRVVQSIVSLVVGVLFIEYLAKKIMWQIKRLGHEALLVRNVILILGYVVVGVIVLSLLGLSGESLLASATFSGLIIGLGMQSVLSNFFSGLIILGSGFLRPGKMIRIASTSIPITSIAFPAYKAFSRDVQTPTLRGTVVEVGLMYTKIALETGELIKVANSMLFTSAVVFEEEEEEIGSPRVQVRYELPIDYEPELVLNLSKKALSELPGQVEVYVEEQSDKSYYILIVMADKPRGFKIREYRSKILEKLINLHRELRTRYPQKI
ncbi:MAG: mechanosensitive ion channel family protein [Desulfurococcaceae archaeon]